MTYYNPTALYWALAAVPVVLLYLARVRPRRYVAGAAFLWQQVLPAERFGSLWRRWRHPVSLLLQVAILGMIVVALAEPHLCAPRRIVLVIDNSRSMNATDVKPTRLAQAKRWACQWLATLAYRDEALVLAAGDPVRVPCRLTGQHEILRQAIEGIAPTGEPARVDQAVALARRLLADCPHGRIVLLSDGRFDERTALANAGDIEFHAVGTAATNLALTTQASAGPPLWTFLAAAALVGLAAEWCLFQRRWTC